MSHWCTTANGFVGFASIATGAAGWLVAKSLSRSALPGCQQDSDCDAVLASRWSRLGAIPVAIPGCLLYALILAGSLVSHPRLSLPAAPWIRPAVLGLALLAGTSALWFVGLQFLVLRRLRAARSPAISAEIRLTPTLPRAAHAAQSQSAAPVQAHVPAMKRRLCCNG